jgi:hypothetical protein
LQATVGLCAVGEFEILLPVAAAHYITNVKIKNKKMKKDFQPEQKPNNEPLPIDSTSSPNCTKPNVICSQTLEIAKFNFITYSNSLSFKDWLLILKNNLTGIDGFYEWFVETYKPKPKHFAIVSKMKNGFNLNMSQLRLIYLSFFKGYHTNIEDNDLMDNVIAILGEQKVYKGVCKSPFDDIVAEMKKKATTQNFSSPPK